MVGVVHTRKAACRAGFPDPDRQPRRASATLPLVLPDGRPASGFGFLPMLEQVVHQVIELRLGDLLGQVGGHRRELGGASAPRPVDLGTRTSLPWASARTRTSPSSRSSRPETTWPFLRARLVARKLWSTLRLGSRMSSSSRSRPRMPMPSSCGPTFAPLPPSWWQMRAVLLEDLRARRRVGLRRGGSPSRRRSISSLSFWSAGGRPLRSVGDPLGDLGHARPLAGRPRRRVLEQPGRRLAGGDGVEQRLGPRGVRGQAAAMASCSRAGAVGRAVEQRGLGLGLVQAGQRASPPARGARARVRRRRASGRAGPTSRAGSMADERRRAASTCGARRASTRRSPPAARHGVARAGSRRPARCPADGSSRSFDGQQRPGQLRRPVRGLVAQARAPLLDPLLDRLAAAPA